MSENNNGNIVAKLWSYCNVLRDDGLSDGDYLEQLTYLLLLKMADEPGGAVPVVLFRPRRHTAGRGDAGPDFAPSLI
jgi:hypothetical protein